MLDLASASSLREFSPQLHYLDLLLEISHLFRELLVPHLGELGAVLGTYLLLSKILDYGILCSNFAV